MSFTIKDIFEKTGIARREIRFYADSEVVIPDEKYKRGRGHHHVYSLKNLRQLKLANALSQFGFPISNVKLVMDSLREGVGESAFSQTDDQLKKQEWYLVLRGKPAEGKLEIQTRLVGGPRDAKEAAITKEETEKYPAILVVNLVALFTR